MERKYVAVGTKNPAKLLAVGAAFAKAFPKTEWEIVGYPVESGVSHQPESDTECLIGAKNRADRAMEASEKIAQYSVGLEGGLHRIMEYRFDCGWAFVRANDGRFGMGSGGSMLLPPAIADVVDAGYEVSVGVDRLFGQENSKHGIGLGGFITNGLYPLQEEYSTAIVIALAPFINPRAYERGGSAWDRAQDGPLDDPEIFYCTHPGCYERSALALQDGNRCMEHVPEDKRWMFKNKEK